MFKKLTLSIILAIFCGSTAFAEVFTVLNNQDSGTGSFRNALINSSNNGNSEIDYIYFNIPGNTIVEHTIKLLTGLPEISTDIVIDATTQSGDAASINGAKIVIEGSSFSDNQSPRIFSISGVNRFEIYGFVIKNFYEKTSGFNFGISPLSFIKSNGNIIIGGVGKGNVFFNCGNISASPAPTVYTSIQNLVVKNIFLGIDEDGIGITAIPPPKIYLFGVYNALIGGNTKAEGNLIYGGIEISPTNYNDPTPKSFSLTIKNNIITANINEERPGVSVARNTAYSGITTSSTSANPEKAIINITENVFGSGITITGFGDSEVLIARNYFGTSRDLSKKLPIQSQAISFINVKGKILLGGTSIAEGNIITNTNNDLGFQKLYPGAVWAERTDKLELSHNSFFCNPEFPFLYSQTGPFAKPLEVFLDNLTSTSVSGRTKPGARVELFYSDPECTNCQPKRYFATVTADIKGNWIYNGNLETGYTILAGATLNGISSEFSDPRIYLLDVGQTFKTTPQTCDNPNGKIESVYLVNVNHMEWLDEAGHVVGTSIDLINVPAGKYRIKAYQFGCIIYSDWAIVEDRRPNLSFTGLPNIVQPSCGNPGSILNLYPNNYKDFNWLDESGNVVSKERELKDVPAGSYTLHLVGLTDCEKNFGPYILKNVSGPSINLKDIKVTNTLCITKTGSIKDIKVNGTGTITYTWTNEFNKVVSNQLDLTNVGAGIYKLKINDESSCNEIISTPYTIVEENGISLDETKALTKKTSCNINNGYVKGILVTGATDYKWINKLGTIVSYDKDLENAAAGEYKLVAMNAFGCSKESIFYKISTYDPVIFPDYLITTEDARCNQNNGTATLIFGNGIKPTSIKWVDNNNTTIAGTTTASNLKEGNYKLYFIDENGCEQLFKTIMINRIPVLNVDEQKIKIINDNCGQALGSIKDIIVTGGKAPYQFSWKNSDNKEISKDNFISNIISGNYTLTITDALACESKTLQFTILNQTSIPETPIVDPISICSPTMINLQVKNATKGGIYKLYSSISSTTPIKEQSTSAFQINVTEPTKYFITYNIGSCESNKGTVSVEINGADLKIPNSFSPNNDGINDFWRVEGLQKYIKSTTRIYNRNGNKVFEYQGENMNFDGKFNGTFLPFGTYYFTISLAENCKQISGSLSIIY